MKNSFNYIDLDAEAGGFIRKDMIKSKKYADEIFYNIKEIKTLENILYMREDYKDIGELRDFRVFFKIGDRDVYVTRMGRVDDSKNGIYMMTPLSFLLLYIWIEKQKKNGMNNHLPEKYRRT